MVLFFKTHACTSFLRSILYYGGGRAVVDFSLFFFFVPSSTHRRPEEARDESKQKPKNKNHPIGELQRYAIICE